MPNELKPIEKCPHCGEEYGLFSKEYVQYEQYYTFEGEVDGYSEFKQLSCSMNRKTTPLYCCRCEKKVTTLEELNRRADQWK